MIKKIQLDLGTITTRNDLFQIFAIAFSFPDYFGNNWDAFFDLMYSLDPQVFLEGEKIDSITGVHLIFLNFDLFQSHFPEDDM